MIRTLLTLSLLLSTAALAAEPRLPVPPIPPLRPPSQDAPMPDPDMRDPTVERGQPSVTLDMSIHRRSNPDASQGYTPGSRYRSEDDRKPVAVPGLRLHFPFQ